jgi:thiamine-monophosphate kinase
MGGGKAEAAATVGGLGEESLVARLVAGLPSRADVLVGPGDDCAVVEGGAGLWRLLKTDSIVEGVHFLPGTDPVRVGRKAMNRVLSDVAAMGGLPEHALVGLACEGGRALAEVEGWYAGLVEAASAAGCAIVGGETSGLPSPGAVLTVSLVGRVEPDRCVLRSRAGPGDVLAVTGRLGGSFESGRHLDFRPRLREARWLVERARPTAMMDLSDGLGSDLPRLAAASGLGYRVDLASLPRHEGVSAAQAAGEGEDYELLMAFSPEVFETLPEAWGEAFPELPLTRIGELVAEAAETPLPRGWEHYRAK